MPKYITLLRGINVGKSNRISKNELSDLYTSLGFQRVEVIIQSGNVIFETNDSKPEAVAAKISAQLKKDFSFDVAVMVLQTKELGKILDASPYLREAAKDAAKVLIGFPSKPIGGEAIKSIDAKAYSPNKFKVTKAAVYLYCPDGVGRAKLPNFEKLLQVKVTFRNIRVCEKLLALA